MRRTMTTTGAAAVLVALLAAVATVEAFMQPLQMMATGVKRNPNFGKLVGGCVGGVRYWGLVSLVIGVGWPSDRWYD